MFDAGPAGDGGAGEGRDPPITVFTARTPFEAQLVASMLRAEGIPDVTVPDENLQMVEFNAARQALNLEACEVKVPRSYAEAALRIIERNPPHSEEKSEEASEDDESDEEEEVPPVGPSLRLLVIVVLLLVVIVVGALVLLERPPKRYDGRFPPPPPTFPH